MKYKKNEKKTRKIHNMSVGGWFNGWTNSNDLFDSTSEEEGETMDGGDEEFPLILDINNFNPEFQQVVQEEQEKRMEEFQRRQEEIEREEKERQRQVREEAQKWLERDIRKAKMNDPKMIERRELVKESRPSERFIETQTNQFYFMIYELSKKGVTFEFANGTYMGIRRVNNMEYETIDEKINELINGILNEKENHNMKNTRQYMVFVNNSFWEILLLMNVKIIGRVKNKKGLRDRRIMVNYEDQTTGENHNEEEILIIGKMVREKVGNQVGKKKLKNSQLLEIVKEVNIEIEIPNEDVILVKVVHNEPNEGIESRYQVESETESEE